MKRETKTLGQRRRAWGERGALGGAGGNGRRSIYFESLVVLLLVGGLAATIAPRAMRCTADCAHNACAKNALRINLEVERWHSAKGVWPKDDLSDIGADPEYFPDGLPVCPIDGSPYELDPVTHRVNRHSLARPSLPLPEPLEAVP